MAQIVFVFNKKENKIQIFIEIIRNVKHKYNAGYNIRDIVYDKTDIYAQWVLIYEYL